MWIQTRQYAFIKYFVVTLLLLNFTVTRTSNLKLSFNFDQFDDLNACSVRSKILKNILLDLLITLLYFDSCLLIIAQVHFMSPESDVANKINHEFWSLAKCIFCIKWLESNYKCFLVHYLNYLLPLKMATVSHFTVIRVYVKNMKEEKM